MERVYNGAERVIRPYVERAYHIGAKSLAFAAGQVPRTLMRETGNFISGVAGVVGVFTNPGIAEANARMGAHARRDLIDMVHSVQRSVDWRASLPGVFEEAVKVLQIPEDSRSPEDQAGLQALASVFGQRPDIIIGARFMDEDDFRTVLNFLEPSASDRP